jgi:hypothetical protein
MFIIHVQCSFCKRTREAEVLSPGFVKSDAVQLHLPDKWNYVEGSTGRVDGTDKEIGVVRVMCDDCQPKQIGPPEDKGMQK